MPKKGQEKGDRKGSGKGKKGEKGGGKWSREDGGGKKGGKGGRGKGESSYWGEERASEEPAPLQGRSQLNSNAPDFKPSGFPYGGMYGPADMQRLWGWQPAGNALPAMPPLWREYADENGTAYYYNSKTGLSQWERPAELDPIKPPPPPEGASSVEKSKGGGSSEGYRDSGKGGDDGYEPRRGGGDGGYGGRGEGREGGKGRYERDRDDRDGGRKGDRGGKRRGGGKPSSAEGSAKQTQGSEFGPPGCNLFVFHLPDDWTDDDLNEYFAPHGKVVSAKVMKELGTGRSRGFGFVSYEDRVSAATAIKKMQGYKILGKRLKVEFKKGEQEGGKGEGDDRGGDRSEDEDGVGTRKGYPDDERLIGYLRAISAKNVVQSLKESESARPQDDAPPDEEEEEEGGLTGD